MRFTTKFEFGMVTKADSSVPYRRVRFSTKNPKRLFGFTGNPASAKFLVNQKIWAYWKWPVWSTHNLGKLRRIIINDHIESKLEP